MADLPHEFFAGKVQGGGGPAYWLSGGGDPTNRRDMSGAGRSVGDGDGEVGGEGEASAWGVHHGGTDCGRGRPPGFGPGGVTSAGVGSVVGEGDGVVGAGGVGEGRHNGTPPVPVNMRPGVVGAGEFSGAMSGDRIDPGDNAGGSRFVLFRQVGRSAMPDCRRTKSDFVGKKRIVIAGGAAPGGARPPPMPRWPP